MKKVILFIIYCIQVNYLFAQFTGQIPQTKKYKFQEVYDSTYGINIYEKLNFGLGGDSIRNDKKGYACQGWVEDYYVSGKLLHKGYYEDGHLKIYKNYYENGQIERMYKISDLTRTNMQIFYSDGKLKSEVTYKNGSPEKWEDFYPNGQLEYIEEFHKSMEYIIQRKSFTQEGKPQSIMELTDHKKKIYSKKEYYENGNLKEEGNMKFSPDTFDYVKDGKWKTYNDEGKKISEEAYSNGQLD